MIEPRRTACLRLGLLALLACSGCPGPGGSPEPPGDSPEDDDSEADDDDSAGSDDDDSSGTDDDDSAATDDDDTNPSGDGPWVTAYLAAWNHLVGDVDGDGTACGTWGNLTTDTIDWSAMTHLVYFALNVAPDGTLATPIECWQNVNSDRLTEIVAAAHAHDTPIVISFGGAGNHDAFASAISPTNRAMLVDVVVDVVTTWGFDGVDIDMEPIEPEDTADYAAFVHELHAALQTLSTPMLPRPLLFLVTGVEHAAMFAELAPLADQVNLMTYDLSGPWPGWVTWHNTPLFRDDYTFPSTGGPLPSIDAMVEAFTSGGVPRDKIGIGVDFYGYVWSGGSGTPAGGVTAPRQEYVDAPSVSTHPYHQILDGWLSPEVRHWDEVALVPWLGLDFPGSADDAFVSYDDEDSCAAKVDYVVDQGLGGLIVWEIAGGLLPEGALPRDPLLQAIKQARADASR
jgi:chitinase